MQYDEQLMQYGIFVDSADKDKVIIKDEKVVEIIYADIARINFKTLQDNGIEELSVYDSSINDIFFADSNDVKITFENCIFKKQILAKGKIFIKELRFIFCVFNELVGFDQARFMDRVDFNTSVFKNLLNFTKAYFLAKQSDDNKAENYFANVRFEDKAFFGESVFLGRACFLLSSFKDMANFSQSKFLANHDNDEIIENDFREVVFGGKASFADTEFRGRTSFNFSHFNSEVNFINPFLDKCEFNNTEFNKTKFLGDKNKTTLCSFANSVFKDTLSFENLEIKELRFYNVVFGGIVTFNGVRLEHKPQFTNCTFSNQFNVEHQYIQYSYEKIEEIEKEVEKYKILLNYRDLFRKLKSNRIAHHNLIDASELHTQELYARELELKYKKSKTLKEWIEKWQLWFYRKICDHHTDLLRSLNSLIIVIGIFGLLSLEIILGVNWYLGLKPIEFHFYPAKDFYDIHIKSLIENNVLCVIGINFAILLFYLGITTLALCASYIRQAFAILSYIAVIGATIISPKILMPAMGIFTDKRALLDPLSTLGGIYTIIFGFVLYSFIKTARKNSIVPN